MQTITRTAHVVSIPVEHAFRTVSPATLKAGDVVLFAFTDHLVMKVDRLDDPRWIARVTWDDGECTLYGPRARVQVA